MKINFVFALILLTSGAAQAASLPDYPFLFETGSAEIEVAPDMAIVDITIADRGSDASKVFSIVNASVAVAIDALGKSKVPLADIDSSGVQRSIDVARAALDKSAQVHYIVSRHVTVRLRDLSVWPQLMAELAKIKNIENLNSDFRISAQKSVGEDLELKAVRDAETRAKRMAESLGRKLGSVMAISRAPLNALERTFMEGQNNAFPPPPFLPPMEPTQTLRVPATITLSRSINVLFKLE